MRIVNVSIKNYKSLKNITLDNLGNLTILIGANSSGKTNFLEALELFFKEFDSAVSRTIGPVSDYLWFDRNSREPISISITISISKSAFKKMFPEPLSKLFSPQKENLIAITRQISGNASSASWNTIEVTVNNTQLIKEGKLAIEESKVSELSTKKQPSISPDKLLGLILQNLSKNLKGIFKIIYAARNYSGSPSKVGDRISFCQPSIISELTTLGQSLQREQEIRWNRIERTLKKASPTIEDIRVLSGQVTIRERGSDMRVPIQLVGGGHQEILGLLHQLAEGEIFGLEEPEIHLHPQLARQLLETLKEISKKTQLFISTHSTVFIDHSDLNSVWIVRKEGKETTFTRIKSAEDLKGVLYELGIKPSDIFFSNGIIFVEGPSERAVLPKLASKIGIDFRALELSIIPIYGKSSGRYHLKVWTEAAKNANIPFFMILDKDAEKEAKSLISKKLLKLNENLFILKEGSIEDYYPNEKLCIAINEIYGIQITEEEKSKILERPRSKSIEEFLHSKGKLAKGWKVELGKKVAELMTVEEIDDELKRVFERIETVLRTQR